MFSIFLHDILNYFNYEVKENEQNYFNRSYDH
jgi:hypothetical protein